MQFMPGKRTRPSIDLSPLVDVVFLLIIFFAVSTTFREGTGLPITLPSAGSATAQPAGPVEVSIGLGGQIELAGKVYPTLEAMQEPFRQALDRATPRSVLIRGDKQAAYDTIIKVLDLARRFEAEGVTLATHKGKGGKTDTP